MLLTGNVSNEGEATSNEEDYYASGCITPFDSVLGVIIAVAAAASVAFTCYDVFVRTMIVSVTTLDE